MKTSSAADPAATHKRNAELPMSGSTPNINPPQKFDNYAACRSGKYGAANNPGASSATEGSMLEFELTFLGDAFERLAGILDPVLIIVAVGRQQPDDLVAAARAGPADRA